MTTKQRWSNKSALEKGALIISFLLAIAVVISAVLLCMDKISTEVSNYIMLPSLFMITLLNGLLTLKQDKRNAIIIFICAAVILACGILTMLLSK